MTKCSRCDKLDYEMDMYSLQLPSGSIARRGEPMHFCSVECLSKYLMGRVSGVMDYTYIMNQFSEKDRSILISLAFDSRRETDRDKIWEYLDYVQVKYDQRITLRWLHSYALTLGAEKIEKQRKRFE